MQKKEERMDIAEVLARRRPQLIAKRAMDIVLSAAALAVLWPLLLLIALAVVIDDPGPVFYRQVRIGRGGKPFRIFKFRTMVTDADKKGLAITVGQRRRAHRRAERPFSGYGLRRSGRDGRPLGRRKEGLRRLFSGR